MIDIHAHLQFPDYDADRDAVIARARAAGVERMIIVGTDLGTSRAAVELAERHDFLYASAGMHPHFFNEIEKEFPISNFQFPNKSQIQNSKFQTEIEGIRELAKHPKVVAIGECGLDYFSRSEPIIDERRKTQREGFLAQMEIAKEFGLPMIIHTRPSVGTMDAYEDVFEILKTDEAEKLTKLKTALHCYQGDTEITKKFLSLPGVYFSFAGNVTYPVKKTLVGTKDDILETVKLVPMGRLFVETDCPYLAPQEYRGTRNEPSYVRLAATTVATAKTVDEDELTRHVEGNFRKLFRGVA